MEAMICFCRAVRVVAVPIIVLLALGLLMLADEVAVAGAAC